MDQNTGNKLFPAKYTTMSIRCEYCGQESRNLRKIAQKLEFSCGCIQIYRVVAGVCGKLECVAASHRDEILEGEWVADFAKKCAKSAENPPQTPQN
jgi:hypothetical protein